MLRRLAVVTDAFKAKVGRLVDTVEWRSPSFKGGRKYLTVSATRDPQDPEDPGYWWVSRVGTDSVAIVFRDDDPEKPYIVLSQYHSPIREFTLGAFTGSLDKEGLDPVEIAIEEAYEEAGYTVTADRVRKMGYVPTGAMSDERVHLYLIDVSGIPKKEIHPENEFEQNTRIFRASASDVIAKCEWKAALIVARAEVA